MQNVKINLNNRFSMTCLVVVFFIFLFCSYNFANAATLSLNPSSGNYSVGETVSVRVYVNSQSELINAVSANLVFSNDTLSLVSISKSGSIINFWAFDPKIINSTGQVSLDGVTISGFSGQLGTIATLKFKVLSEGFAYVRFAEAEVLAHDGRGTNVLKSSNEAGFTISGVSKINEVNQVVNSILKKPESNTYTNEGIIEIEEAEKFGENFDIKKPVIVSPSFKKGDSAYFFKLIIVVSLLVLVLIIGFIRIQITKKTLSKNIQNVKKVVSKTFNLLEDDEYEESKLIRGLKNPKNLTEDEEATLNHFSRDLNEAEKIINEEINNLKNK